MLLKFQNTPFIPQSSQFIYANANVAPACFEFTVLMMSQKPTVSL